MTSKITIRDMDKIRELAKVPSSERRKSMSGRHPYMNFMTFMYEDFDFLVNEKAMSKVLEALDRTPYHFHFILDNVGHEFMYLHDDDMSWIEPEDNVITFASRSNFTNTLNWMPLTAWIWIHRISHGIQTMVRQGKLGGKSPEIHLFRWLSGIDNLMDQIKRAVKNLWSVEELLISSSSGPFHSEENFNGFNLPGNNIKQLITVARNLFTMQSAKQGRLNNEVDIFGEILAQFVISGSIKFKRWDDLSKDFRPTLFRPEASQAFDRVIETMEQDLNKRFADYMETLKGQVIYF